MTAWPRVSRTIKILARRHSWTSSRFGRGPHWRHWQWKYWVTLESTICFDSIEQWLIKNQCIVERPVDLGGGRIDNGNIGMHWNQLGVILDAKMPITKMSYCTAQRCHTLWSTHNLFLFFKYTLYSWTRSRLAALAMELSEHSGMKRTTGTWAPAHLALVQLESIKMHWPDLEYDPAKYWITKNCRRQKLKLPQCTALFCIHPQCQLYQNTQGKKTIQYITAIRWWAVALWTTKCASDHNQRRQIYWFINTMS